MAQQDEAASAPVRKDRSHSKSTSPPFKATLTNPLPTRRIAFSKQLDILRAYPTICGPVARAVSNGEISLLVDMAPDTISMGNPFFAGIGLLDRGDNGHTPCAELMAYAHFFQWNPDKPEAAFEKLRPVFLQSWFAKILIPRLRFKNLTEEEAITVLAEACGATPEYRGQVRMLLDYLEQVEIIHRDGGTVSLVRAAGAETLAASSPPAPAEASSDRRAGTVDTTFSKGNAGGIQLNVNISVDMNEMAKWRPDRISAFLAGLASVLAAKGEVEKAESGQQ